MFAKKLMALVVTTVFLLVGGCGQREVSYSTEVAPILQAHCAGCHSGGGEGESASGFGVTSYDDLMQGTQYGQVVVAGSAVSSTLYHMIAGTVDPAIQMPPQHPEALAEGRGEPLSPEQIEAVVAYLLTLE